MLNSTTLNTKQVQPQFTAIWVGRLALPMGDMIRAVGIEPNQLGRVEYAQFVNSKR